MSIINVGDIPINENLVDGTELARRLERLYAAFHSQNSNATRPPSVTAGGIWSKTVAGGFEMMFYDGTNDIKIGEVAGGAIVLNSNFVNLAYTGTLTGGTGVINIGSGQIYKDASGNVGFGVTDPSFPISLGNDKFIAFKSTSGGYDKGIKANTNNELLFFNGVDGIRLSNTGNTGFGLTSQNPAGRVDVLANGYGTFVARSASAGVATDVIAMKAIDSAGAAFANAAYQARSHVWGYNGATLGMELTAGGVLSLPNGQIKFPAAQIASTDPNTLDDYEEGTWTTSFASYSNCSSASLANGTYVKVGKTVTLFGYITITKTAAGLAYVNFQVPFQMNTGQTSAGMATSNASNAVAIIAPYGSVTAKTDTYFLIPASSGLGAISDSYMFSYTYQTTS